MGQAFPVDMNLLTQHEKPTITNVGFKIDIELDSQVRVVVKSSFYQLRPKLNLSCQKMISEE